MAVHLIAGPPGAGKTTYALEKAGPTDRVVDYDLIKARVGPDKAQAVRLAAEAMAPDYDAGDVYIVRSVADPHDRKGVAIRVKADTVTVLAVPADVATARKQSRDGPTTDTSTITQWWDKYAPAPGDTTIQPTHQPRLVGRATVPRQAPGTGTQTMSDTQGTPTPADVAKATAPNQGQAGEQAPTNTTPPANDNQGTGSKLPQTQEELDRIIGERVARAERKYEGFDKYKAAYDGQDDRVAAARREAEAETAKRFTERLARTTVESEATRAGFRDPADALAQVSLSEFVAGEDIDRDKVSAKLTEIATHKPYLLADSGPTRGPQRIRRNKDTSDDKTPTQGHKSADLIRRLARGQ